MRTHAGGSWSSCRCGVGDDALCAAMYMRSRAVRYTVHSVHIEVGAEWPDDPRIMRAEGLLVCNEEF